MNHKVAVLLAAYNGSLWLEEQVNSILAQCGVDVKIFISVDKSNDGTERMVDSLVEKHANIVALEHGHHFGGAGKNFFRLFSDVDFSGFDFISLSDQDDIWNSDKLCRACLLLSEYMVYSSNVIAFYENGHQCLIDKAQPHVSHDFIFEAAGPGCTYVFKRDVAVVFQTWLIKHYDEVRNEISLHDWLLYAFARSFGYSWFIDPEPSMLYRQHANNQVGTNNSFEAGKKRLKLIKDKWYRGQVTQIAEHLELQDISIVKHGLKNGYVGNIYLLFHVNQLRRRLRDRIALSFALLFNLF